jgi:hypothetical protein
VSDLFNLRKALASEAVRMLDVTKSRVADRIRRGGKIEQLEQDVAVIVQHHLDRYHTHGATSELRGQLMAYAEGYLAGLTTEALGGFAVEDERGALIGQARID